MTQPAEALHRCHHENVSPVFPPEWPCVAGHAAHAVVIAGQPPAAQRIPAPGVCALPCAHRPRRTPERPGPYAPAPGAAAAKAWASCERARDTRAFIVPTGTPQISAASS